MSDVLDLVLSIFDCDRASLLYPCDPVAEAWRVPMERSKPEYPGSYGLGLPLPMDADIAQTFRILWVPATGDIRSIPASGTENRI